MARKRFTVEQIIAELREAEVELSKSLKTAAGGLIQKVKPDPFLGGSQPLQSKDWRRL